MLPLANRVLWAIFTCCKSRMRSFEKRGVDSLHSDSGLCLHSMASAGPNVQLEVPLAHELSMIAHCDMHGDNSGFQNLCNLTN